METLKGGKIMPNKKTNKPTPEKTKVEKVAETVDAKSEEYTSQEEVSVTKIAIVSNCKMLNVRASASFDAEILAVINDGEEVEIIDDCPDGDFYEVVCRDNISGFCAKDYITEITIK